MNTKKNMLAIDIGAGSGRVFIGSFDGNILQIEEKSRFHHNPIMMNGETYLDFLHIWNCVKQGAYTATKNIGPLSSIGLDSFAPDFCMFDKHGTLLSNPLSYRTMIGSGILKEIYAKNSEESMFSLTGLQGNEILTLPQLMYLQKKKRNWLLQQSKTLPLVNAITYLLTDEMTMDFTTASVSMLWDSTKNCFSKKILDEYVGYDSFLPELSLNQTAIGNVKNTCEVDSLRGIAVLNSGVHDTTMATYALNLVAQGQLCMNCGTWTSIGVVEDLPITNTDAFKSGLTNYGLPDGRFMYGNVMLGLFYLQECLKEWANDGEELTYEQITKMASNAKTYTVDLNHEIFSDATKTITQRISGYFAILGKDAPKTKGEYLRCIYASLALKYAQLIQTIEQTCNKKFERIYMGGGGMNSPVFCEIIKQATGKNILPVAVEVTVIGNLLSQLISQQSITAQDARQIFLSSFCNSAL